jgi:hypothetical protein
MRREKAPVRIATPINSPEIQKLEKLVLIWVEVFHL